MGQEENDPGLRAIRESRGISLERIADETKIGLFYLRSIEAGRLKKLPGEFYARSYVRQYARAAGFDEHDVLLRLDLLSPAARESASRTEPPALLQPAEE